MTIDHRERLQRALLGRLESLAASGVQVLPKPRLVNLPLSSSLPGPVPISTAAEIKTVENPPVRKTSGWAAANASMLFTDEDAMPKIVSSATTLEVLQQEVAVCTRCDELARTRKQTVFGVGNPNARLCFMGEAPGADEDRLGEPFAGRAGQLLDKIIAACKLKREDVYICNVLKCRPPGNRNPLPDEASN